MGGELRCGGDVQEIPQESTGVSTITVIFSNMGLTKNSLNVYVIHVIFEAVEINLNEIQHFFLNRKLLPR